MRLAISLILSNDVMTLLRITGGLWLTFWLMGFIGVFVNCAPRAWSYWMLLDLVLFNIIGFLGYSVLRGRRWASKPLGFVAFLLGIWMFFNALARGFSLSVIGILFFSAWTYWISICNHKRAA
jgi:hypothetical protein